MFPEERERGQEFVVDVTLAVQEFPADDDLTSTVDYSKVAGLVVERIQSGPFQLIETLAGEIARNVLAAQPLAERVTVTVHKPNAPLLQEFDDVLVTITRSR